MISCIWWIFKQQTIIFDMRWILFEWSSGMFAIIIMRIYSSWSVIRKCNVLIDFDWKWIATIVKKLDKITRAIYFSWVLWHHQFIWSEAIGQQQILVTFCYKYRFLVGQLKSKIISKEIKKSRNIFSVAVTYNNGISVKKEHTDRYIIQFDWIHMNSGHIWTSISQRKVFYSLSLSQYV